MERTQLGRELYELGLRLGGLGTVLIGSGGGSLAKALARCAGCGVALAGGEARFHDGTCAACGAWLAEYYDFPAALFIRQDGGAVEWTLLNGQGKPFTPIEPVAPAPACTGEWDILAGADCAWAANRAGDFYVERGWWLDLNSGRIDQTLNLRPMKALKYVKGEDSRFGVLEVPELYIYPGEGDRRVRWESAVPRPLTAEEQARLPRLAQPDLAAAVKRTKGTIKNTLAPKFLAALVPVGALGKVGEAFVLEDPAGARIVLRDRPEDGADHASTARLAMLPGAVPAGSALFGLMFYDEGDRSLCLHPYSVVTPDQIIRLQF